LLDVGVGEAVPGVGADQLGLDAEVAGHGADVRLGRLQELGLLGRDRDGLELGAVAEHGDVAVAGVRVAPSGLDLVGPLLPDVLVRGEHTAGDGGLAEELGGVLLGAEAEADGLAGVADR
jgi:hypothetical protein